MVTCFCLEQIARRHIHHPKDSNKMVGVDFSSFFNSLYC